MGTINRSDMIFARATMMGREVMNVKLSGLESTEALLDAVRGLIGGAVGMVTLSVRNLSQGWSSSRSYMMRRAA